MGQQIIFQGQFSPSTETVPHVPVFCSGAAPKRLQLWRSCCAARNRYSEELSRLEQQQFRAGIAQHIAAGMLEPPLPKFLSMQTCCRQASAKLASN